LISTTPPGILGGWLILANDLVETGMGGKRHVATGEVGLADGRLEGRRRRPFGHVDEPELGLPAEAAVQRG
jgi:hypothetical protein